MASFFWTGKAQITHTFSISGRFLEKKKSIFLQIFFLGSAETDFFKKFGKMAKSVKVYRILNFENSLRQVGESGKE